MLMGVRKVPIVGGVAFSPLSIAIFGAFSAAPSEARKRAIDTFVKALVAADIWNSLEYLGVRRAADSQAALVNWIDPDTSATLVNAPTFTADAGFAGNGSTSYVDSGFVPSDGTEFLQDDAAIGVVVTTVRAAAGVQAAIGTNSGVVGTSLYPRYTGDVGYAEVNGNGGAGGDFADRSSSGFFVAVRTSSTTVRRYIDGEFASEQTGISSAGRSTASMLECASRSGVTAPADHSTDQIALAFAGAALTDEQVSAFQDAWLKYCADTGSGIEDYPVIATSFATVSETLFLLGSNDEGATWVQLAASYEPSEVVRNPSLMRRNGTWWLVHSNVTGFVDPSDSFTVASSPDGRRWSKVAEVDMTAISGIDFCWAARWFVDDDESVHVFFAASADNGTTFKIYETHPTNAAMTAWSAPVEVTGTGFPSKMLDPFIVRRGSTYYLWYKNETAAQTVEYASSASLTSGYVIEESGDWAGWGTNLEAQSLIQLDNGDWRIFLDAEGAGISYSDSSDDWATWTAKAAITAPFTPQGPAVIRQP